MYVFFFLYICICVCVWGGVGYQIDNELRSLLWKPKKIEQGLIMFTAQIVTKAHHKRLIEISELNFHELTIISGLNFLGLTITVIEFGLDSTKLT